MAICGNRNWLSGLLGVFSITGVLAHVIFCGENHALAQITPDGTLGNNSSIITPNVNIKGLPADRIDGGAIRGANLFHSFGEFNVRESQRVYFANPTGISNILTRVTGSNISNILGTLGVNGGANLFFINPNGILFGKNARLDVAGSFVASTANSFVFGNGLKFSATNPQTPSALLTVNLSALLFNQLQAGRIENKSIAPAGDNLFGLRVPDSRSLVLVGGDVAIDGGRLNAPGGRVELGGLTGEGTVKLNFTDNNLSLSFPDSVARANVTLTNGAEVNVRAKQGGSIAINAQNIDVLGASKLQAGIASGLGSVDSQAGNIDINATAGINITNETLISNAVPTGGLGNAGGINITAGFLSITDSALSNSNSGNRDAGSISLWSNGSISLENSDISTNTNYGNAGNISLKSNGSISLKKSNLLSSTNYGNAGNISLQSNSSISLLEDSYLDSDSFFEGNAGSISLWSNGSISIKDSILDSETSGNRDNTGSILLWSNGSISIENSGFWSATFKDGDAGSISLQSNSSIFIKDSTVSSQTARNDISGSNGNGGDIHIQAQSLSLTDGARLFASTYNKGKAGNILVNTSDFVNLSRIDDLGELSGMSTATEFEDAGPGGEIIITTGVLRMMDKAFLNASTTSGSPAGSITVNANNFEAASGAQLSTTTSGRGPAGDITLKITDSMTLAGANSGLFANTTEGSSGKGGSISIDPRTITIRDDAKIAVDSQGTGVGGNIDLTAGFLTLDNGTIFAETRSNTGGNITLKLQDLLLLRNGSQISTTAGNNQFGGDGGNITINTPFIVAVPKENSDITANAFTGKGGRVDITTNGIFGIVPQKSPTEKSDITASSELGVSGEVDLNTPDTDPGRGLIQLPSNLVDASEQIAQGCTPRRGQNASRFIATGRGGLPQSPNEPLRGRAVITGWVDLPPQATAITDKSFTPSMTKSTDQIVEAQGWIVNGNGDIMLVAQSGQSSSIPSAMSCSQ
ncbi:MAG: S-layer family protein [Nostoc sp.]|uniref:S-layer family protein n=1 Tax=Nostoc sp. TaxID=1180 RepID=UPI002FF64E84